MLIDLKEGQFEHDVYVPMKHYMCVSRVRWNETLYRIFNHPSLYAEFI